MKGVVLPDAARLIFVAKQQRKNPRRSVTAALPTS